MVFFSFCIVVCTRCTALSSCMNFSFEPTNNIIHRSVPGVKFIAFVVQQRRQKRRCKRNGSFEAFFFLFLFYQVWGDCSVYPYTRWYECIVKMTNSCSDFAKSVCTHVQCIDFEGENGKTKMVPIIIEKKCSSIVLQL